MSDYQPSSTCLNCGEPGHSTIDCPKKLNDSLPEIEQPIHKVAMENKNTRKRSLLDSIQPISDWFAQQDKNRKSGRVIIDLEYVQRMLNTFSKKLLSLLESEEDPIVKSELSALDVQAGKINKKFSRIKDIYNQADDYKSAKRDLTTLHEKVLKLTK